MYYSKKLRYLFNFVDFICIGDGEFALKSIIEKQELDKVPNIVFIDKSGDIKFTETKYCGLNKLVIPNFDGFKLDKYFTSKLILPVFTSRSCYSNCSFCTIAKATSGPYRTYSIENTIHMIKTLQKKYNCNYFTFVDETFNARRLLEFSKQIIAENIKIYWYTETRLDYYLTLEDTKLLYQAGCRKMQFGVESYNENILELMNKKIKFNNIKSTIKNFIDAQIGVHLFFMIGFPGETKKGAENSLAFMKEMYKYGNNTSNALLVTTGFGSFGLEIGSPVQQDPEKFQISIKTDFNNEDFIGLGLEYDVQGEFLSSNESEEIVSINKDFGQKPLFSYSHKLFSEMQNFLEISSKIITDHPIAKTNNKVLKINYGLFNKNDCNYLVTNVLGNKFYLARNMESLDILTNSDVNNITSFDSLLSKRLNPFIEIDDTDNTIYLKNKLSGDEFEIETETMEEILKFRIPPLNTTNNSIDSDNMDFYNFIVSNNIIY